MSGAARIIRPDTDAALAVLPYRRLWLNMPRGIWCLVDLDDYEWIIANNWNVGWHRFTRWKHYAKRNVGAERSTVYLHREILSRVEAPPSDAHVGDHVNGQSLDDRKANLRWLTRLENNRNARSRENIPTLDHIVARLLAAHVPAREIPF